MATRPTIYANACANRLVIGEVRLRKRCCGQLNVGPGDPESLRCTPPMPCVVQHFSDDGATSILRFGIPLGGLDHSRKTRAVVRLIDVQHVVGSVRVRVQIEGGGETPARRGQKKAVVS